MTTSFDTMPLASLVTPRSGMPRAGMVGEVVTHNYLDETIEVYFDSELPSATYHISALRPADSY